jgi:YtkA-like
MKRLVLLALAAACSSGGSPASSANASFPPDAYANATSDSGKLRVEVRTSPQPPPRGACAVELAVTDASSAPVDGLNVSVVPWMDAMGHGASIKTEVTPKGGGKYVVGNVSLFMPGTWTLRIAFAGPVDDHAAPLVDVP